MFNSIVVHFFSKLYQLDKIIYYTKQETNTNHYTFNANTFTSIFPILYLLFRPNYITNFNQNSNLEYLK